ncbi:hypothetical protein KG112_10420 [Nocardioides sp. zg-ZUI104]|uniref:hypothetical protein n=1 Tax=Nocardioides faecalis TaxID=2803858 RepID=UPI001BCB4720|nr:hypothetical protein [Nocardioides faecalis]MBS4753216.1 hypothetical protein [Nocardioides faecalis]
MTAWTELDEATQELSWQVLDHAVDSLAGGGPLTPFAVVVQRGEKTLHRFADETLEEGVAAARAFLGGHPGAEAAALAYDGYLTREGVRTDAVYVEVHRRGRPTAGCLAQRYAPGAPPELIGNATDCGDLPPLLGKAGPPTGTAAPRKRWLFRR